MVRISIITNPNAYAEVPSHHALRALQSLRALLEKGSRKSNNVTAERNFYIRKVEIKAVHTLFLSTAAENRLREVF